MKTKIVRRTFYAGLLLLGLSLVNGCAKKEKYDVLLRGGTVIDGTGAPGVVTDLAIRGDRIATIGKIDGEAALTIDASGLMVTPGFIDMHSHSDETRLIMPHGPSFSLQGVTTEVYGEDSSMDPWAGNAPS